MQAELSILHLSDTMQVSARGLNWNTQQKFNIYVTMADWKCGPSRSLQDLS